MKEKSYRLEQFDRFWVLTKREDSGSWKKWVVEGPLAAARVVERNRDGRIVEVIALNDKLNDDRKENKHEQE